MQKISCKRCIYSLTHSVPLIKLGILDFARNCKKPEKQKWFDVVRIPLKIFFLSVVEVEQQNCAFPSTYQGQLYYGCMPMMFDPSNDFTKFYCLVSMASQQVTVCPGEKRYINNSPSHLYDIQLVVCLPWFLEGSNRPRDRVGHTHKELIYSLNLCLLFVG